MPRVLVWYSCGASSAVAVKLAIAKYGAEAVEAVYCDTGGEDADNQRFLADCEKWFNKKVTVLKNDKYSDHFDVFLKTGWLVGPQGARCTVELKKKLRFEYQRWDDIQVFGYTVEEHERARHFNEAYPEIKTDFILIDESLTKANCMGIVWQSGIELPRMYRLNYNHNNCVGASRVEPDIGTKFAWTFQKHLQRWQALREK